MALVTLNGKEIQVDNGKLILDVAREAGYEIPTFCYHVKLGILASCRMCLVEIEGMRKLQPSCATPVMDGMKIQTESPDVINARKSQLEFLLINHPLDCPVCDQAGECDLQDLTFKFANTSGRYRWNKRTFPKRDMGQTNTKEMNRCIGCRRCSRYCEEISGDFAITELNRGNALEMGSFCHTPIESEFIGNTAQLCPVGALTSSLFRFKARVWDLISTETICPHCSVGCSITSESKYVSQKATHMCQTQRVGSTPALNTTELKVLRNVATEDKGVTEISLCDRGRYGYHYINSPDRLNTPLIRKNGKLVETSWDDALSVVASRLLSIKNSAGGDAVGGITSGICSNEDGYVFQKFLRSVVGTNNIDIPKGYSLSLASARRLAVMRGGVGAVKTADAILVLGSSLSTDAPIVSMHAGIAGRGGAKLITIMAGENRLVTSRPTALTCAGGTETMVVAALTKAVIEEKLYIDAFANERKEELKALSVALKGISLEEAEAQTGISKEAIEETARTLTEARRGMILFGEDLLLGEKADQTVEAIYNLASLVGYAGEKGRALFAPASGNLIGSLDMGLAPDFLPGYEPVGKGNFIDAPEETGLAWPEMRNAAVDGTLKALYVMGDDPVGTDQDREAVKKSLEKLEFLVVQDIFLTRTAELADVVLPALSYAEKCGTVTNLEGRVQRLNRSITPQVKGRKDWEIIRDVAQSMGSVLYFDSQVKIVDEKEDQFFEEISKTVATYGGLTLESVKGDGQLSDASLISQPPLVPVEIDGKGRPRDEAYPLQIIPGRDVFLNGSTTWRDEGLLKLSPGPKVLISETDGRDLGISNGDQVTIETKEGSARSVASLTARVAAGCVIVPLNHPDLDAGQIFGKNGPATFGKVTKG